jgi:hypothetical protein
MHPFNSQMKVFHIQQQQLIFHRVHRQALIMINILKTVLFNNPQWLLKGLQLFKAVFRPLF